MKVLISWYATNNDFIGNEVNANGPTCQFHQHFFEYDKHIILSSREPDEDPALDRLVNYLEREHRGRRIEGRGMSVSDPINMPDIKAKIETLLLSLSAVDQIDLFISPGTPAMQVAWYLCHMGLSLPTRLLQTRAAQHTKTKQRPELIVIQAEQSAVPVSVVLREQLQTKPAAGPSDFLITDVLEPVYARALRIAETDRVTCLIQGDSGTGKEHLARYIHQQSTRADKPFVAVNCSALGDTLLESRLFGYEKGAFTGADKKTLGFFEAAKGGTLFLDEIGDISPYMQQVLLRVIQEQSFTAVGSTREQKTDVRLIAATHRSLRQACQVGSFRWDLFYRLSVAELQLPALADWTLDGKRALIDQLVRSRQKALQKQTRLTFTPAARRLLDQYLFPGNIRELENLIESLYVFTDGTVDTLDLPDWLRQPDTSLGSFNWQAHEKALIHRAMTYFNGNKTRALEALGYGSVNTLNEKITKYSL